METRRGGLFDLGGDGLGFIADAEGNRIWAFRYKAEGRSLADNVEAFLNLEGEQVQFVVNDGNRIKSIERAATAAGHG